MGWPIWASVGLLMPHRIETRSTQPRNSKVETAVAPEVFGFLNSAGVSKGLIEFRKKQLLFSQGEPAKNIFYIQEGSVKLAVTSTAGKEAVVAILGPGEFFGEMSFVDGAPTSARVVAEEPTRLRMIDEANVDNLTRIDPSFAGRLYRSIAAILVERLRRSSMHLCLENRQV